MEQKYIDQFHSRYRREASTGCWIWQHNLSGDGTGRMKIQGKNRAAARVSAEIYGLDTTQPFIVHYCGQGLCVNPQHLRAMTAEEKMTFVKQRDLLARGEQNPSHKLTEQQVLAMRSQRHLGHTELSRLYGVSRQQVYRILSGRNWTHI